MAESLGPSIQTITDGRLTLKKAHLEYLGDPANIDISYGPAKSIILHNPDRRLALVEEILGGPDFGLDKDQNQIELRLDSVAQTVPVDEQGRIRVPEVHLKFAGLTDKSCKVTLLPRRRNGWLEVWAEQKFDDFVADPSDQWLDALNRQILRRREERGQADSQG
jgi:DNA-binding transcriptional regulator/RsmH inhibitor MraZ